MLVLAVIGSAAGEIAQDEWGLPSSMGAGLMLGLVVVLMFFGRSVVTLIMAYWSFYLFAVLAVYLIVAAMSLDLKPTLALPPSSETADTSAATQYRDSRHHQKRAAVHFLQLPCHSGHSVLCPCHRNQATSHSLGINRDYDCPATRPWLALEL